ncbi:hypothetical protein KY290_010798 [Solanum tuberosum]|uniref:Uncharacterized protein n=1 Tax=Solanum tuberosum TaxID=4113 RepID=A0ABQ7VYU0_SOLTU|nr:hypothetical protein KY290_010798 [Solanum tuberosum]
MSDFEAENLTHSYTSSSSSQLDRIVHFCQQSVLRGRVVTGFGGPKMAILLTKLESQRWSTLFLQGDRQRKLAKQEVTEFYINGKSDGLSFISTVRNTPLHLVPANVAQILGIPSEGWNHYVKNEWPLFPNQSSALDICHKFSSKPTLNHHRSVGKKEMSHLHKLYFDVVHKIIL